MLRWHRRQLFSQPLGARGPNQRTDLRLPSASFGCRLLIFKPSIAILYQSVSDVSDVCTSWRSLWCCGKRSIVLHPHPQVALPSFVSFDGNGVMVCIVFALRRHNASGIVQTKNSGRSHLFASLQLPTNGNIRINLHHLGSMFLGDSSWFPHVTLLPFRFLDFSIWIQLGGSRWFKAPWEDTKTANHSWSWGNKSNG